MIAKTTIQLPEKVLQKHFGYSTFRPQQLEVITHVLEGNDTVVLMPTGGGKSICFQVPALILPGVTVVISPLIALMKDQVQSLEANGIKAAFFNSTLSETEEHVILDRLNKGEIKLLYVSPERLYTPRFFELLQQINISLFAIDEAHCISSWGHHFRPEYRKLSALKKQFPAIPVIALTATADRAVRTDIGEMLQLQQPKYFISSFDRPNLSLAVLPGQKKYQQIVQIIRRNRDESGIIYCSSRNATEKLAEKLQKAGFKAEAYHAGLNADERSSIQDKFIQDRIHIICATVAFGMGIDKPDVRYVIHHNMPGNIESYYQEIGRAGRDGLPAETVLFYSYRDVQTHLTFIEELPDDKYQQIQRTKLEQMQKYAEGQICRRKILLSYFSEAPGDDCNNCDVCQNPPKYFDGTVPAQMALSAIIRTGQRAGITTLVDILKGSMSPMVRQLGFNHIKTFGAGREYTAFDWQLFIQQFIQQGIIELDYKDHYNLKTTEISNDILFNKSTIKLVSSETVRERLDEQKKQNTAFKTVTSVVNESLFEHLRKLRKEIAEQLGKPAFVIFSDASLKDMSGKAPTSIDEFLEVSGVGEHKARQFAAPFLKAINEYTSGKTQGNAYTESWELFQQGLTVEQIAIKRRIHETTVYSHLSTVIGKGIPIDIHNLVDQYEINMVKGAVAQLGNNQPIKTYFEHLERQVSFGKVRLIFTWLEAQ
ncbi:DNA helicase RecQ [Prolixibacteraceae bacterium JC049]|nr:DNA helicase RecQ [Prolixibacteraceae bacterium JC049]